MKNKIFIHNSSIVDEGATIGSGTKIWHFSHIMSGCRIGKNCSFGQNTFVADGVLVGNNVKIQNNVSLFSGVVCEDDVFVGPSVVFTNVGRPRSHIVQKDKYQSTIVKKGATIGANVTVVCSHTIGRYALIGAGAVVADDIPNYALVYGNPATIRGWVCECGQALNFEEKNTAICKSCKQSYSKRSNHVFKRKISKK